MAGKRSTKATSPDAKRSASLEKANRRREATLDLKAEVRNGTLDAAALLEDPRAADVRILTLLPMIPRCTLRVALDALLVCQVNGARSCSDLTAEERAALVDALSRVGHGVGRVRKPPLGDEPIARDQVLDRALRKSRRDAPVVELRPSEFAKARTGLEADPLLLRMVDRLVWALRAYVDDDDGGRLARIVLEQFVRYQNYLPKVASGEYPRPTQRGPAVVE